MPPLGAGGQAFQHTSLWEIVQIQTIAVSVTYFLLYVETQTVTTKRDELKTEETQLGT
jgi:hypothetical protein